ncbi:hypothetical protein GY45DRAFT_1059901 [Cubamyces sp. BRFM 1775]|nr:hypothetical protein GY45DRAFT_1059901 [Cubamyces sp. BRFM 1775]
MVQPLAAIGRILMCGARSALALILLGYSLRCINAQSLGLESTCLDPSPSFSWMYNIDGKSPCETANDLLYACGQFQIGPTLNNSPCVCNSVTYSLAYACRVCSGVPDDQITPFSDYASSYDCESTSIGSFPEPIPSGTVVPGWAYLPLANDGKLDMTKAQDEANEGSGDASTPSVTPQTLQTSSQGSHTTSGHTDTPTGTSAPSDSTGPAASTALQSTGSGSHATDSNTLSTVHPTIHRRNDISRKQLSPALSWLPLYWWCPALSWAFT